MKTALVLSGGGSKGGFQVGALNCLREAGYTFDIVAGVSVGSINGSMVAQNKFNEMNVLWGKITEKDIHTKKNIIQILWNNLIRGKRSLYDLRPLHNLLSANVNKDDVKIPFYMGITSLYTGKYHSVEVSDFTSNDDLINGIYASSLMPIYWEPIDVKIGDYVIKDAVDGGVRNNTPLSDVLKENPDKIVIICCGTPQTETRETPTIINVADRTFLDIMMTEVLDNDVRQLLWINNLVKQAEAAGTVLTHPETGRVYKYFDVVMIQPPFKLSGPTDFSRSNIEVNMKLGYLTASAIISGN